jgi:hypothetical protein
MHRPGPCPPQAASIGHHTDLYRIDTVTQPFNGDGGRDHEVFRIHDPSKRRYTMTSKETAKAHAGIGVGWSLVWRFRAVNTGTAGKSYRFYGQGHARVPGMAPSGSGAAIRVASYNMRVQSSHRERNEDPWSVRARRVVHTIGKYRPDIVLAQELFPSMVTTFDNALVKSGLNKVYALNRYSALDTGAEGEKQLQTRLLYDKTQYAMVSNCPDVKTDASCLIKWHSNGGPDFAAFALMKHISSGQRFWICSFHLTHGSAYDTLRREAMKTIVGKLGAMNVEHYPIILGGDSNSSQLRSGRRPHDVLMSHGYYDTASTVIEGNAKWGTENGFQYEKPSKFGISPRIDLIVTKGMPGSSRFYNARITRPQQFPSDHNMIYADLRLP